jgi:hypothetical protein
MTKDQKIIKGKVGLLELARQLGLAHSARKLPILGQCDNAALPLGRASTHSRPSTIPGDQARFSLALRYPVDDFLSFAPPPPPPPATTFHRRLHVIFTRAPLIYFPSEPMACP